jgi:hypothetical protein
MRGPQEALFLAELCGCSLWLKFLTAKGAKKCRKERKEQLRKSFVADDHRSAKTHLDYVVEHPPLRKLARLRYHQE